ncbi:MAG: hypothetical protein HOH43_22375 [Candidatus Latescibacteria bacterium]|nr:hypothetical protein [Candidatus Latescibacterota bacterium]
MKTSVFLISVLTLVGSPFICQSRQEFTPKQVLGQVGGPYADLDRHAVEAPELVTSSLERLTAYLIRPARTDDERIRAIYRWVTHNIAYDAGRLAGGVIFNVRAPEVLKHRQALCGGYASLIEAMASAAGIETEVVIGHSRGYDYAGQFPEGQEILHAWNAVKINGQWMLLDATWGSGYLDESGVFVRAFREHYFLTPPEQFLYDHWPRESTWQIVDFPISRKEYNRRVRLAPAFFDYGLQVGSHARSIVQVDKITEITIFSPGGVDLASQLLKNGQPKDETFTFDQRDDQYYKIHIKLNRAGEHTLRVFARYIQDDVEQFDWVAEYTIVSKSSTFGATGFPQRSISFMERQVYLETPMSGYLNSGENYPFKVRAPAAADVAIVIGESWTHLTKNGDWYTGDVTAEKGEIALCARYEDKEEYAVMLVYQGL